MTNLITLSKFKAMSSQELANALEARDTISVEAGGQHLFDVVKPLNALDEQFLTISRYVGREVASEFKRKIETLRVEDMFDSRNVQNVLDGVAAKINARGVEDVVSGSKPAAPEKKPSAKAKATEKRTAPEAKKPARQRPSRAKSKAAVLPSSPLASTEAFEQDDLSLTQDLNEDLVASEAPLSNVAHEGLDSEPYPENTHDAEEFFADTLPASAKDTYGSLPDDALFADLKEMEMSPDEIAAEDLDDEEDDDNEFSDGPIVRNIARKRA